MERHGTRLHGAMTEHDCLRAARESARPTSADYFGRLTRSWLEIAYAHRPPAQASLAPLIDAWREHFSLGADEAGDAHVTQEPRHGA